VQSAKGVFYPPQNVPSPPYPITVSVSVGAGPKEQGSCGMERREAQLWLCSSCRCSLDIQTRGHLKWGFVTGSPLLSSAPVLAGRELRPSAALLRGAAKRLGGLIGAHVFCMLGWARGVCECDPGWEAEGELRASLEMASGGLVLICESKFFRPLQFQMAEDSMG